MRTTTFFDGPLVDGSPPAPPRQGRAGGSGPETSRPLRETKPPGPKRAGNHLLVTLIFWFTLAASVEVWWLNTPRGSVNGSGTAMIAAGRITGMISGFLLLVVIVTMSRVGWLEYWFGAHDLLNWHKSLGGTLIVLTVAHAGLLIFGYASVSKVSATRETWQMLTTLEDMVSACIATGIMILLGILAIRLFRRHLPYELWHTLHLSGYVVLLLAYGHQFALGAELIKPGFARWYWITLHVFVGVCVLWGRIVEPLAFNLRHRFRVIDVVAEAPDWVSIYVGGRRFDRLDTQAGQYFRWRFLARGVWWQSHPFSISAAPNAEWLRVSVKAIGGHTRALMQLRPGVRVLLSGPSGAFTPDRRVCDRALLIAGGSGIAPVRSLLEAMPADTVLLYRASSEEELIFRDELDNLAYERGARVYYVVGSRNEPWPRRAFTPAGLRELVPDVKRRDVYLCGPPGLIAMARKAVRGAGVRRRQIHLDPFEF
ncbi:MAG: ferric reductase-like transmembrane domain-containing protein [Micromonosporaceae bacterium]|nr:ferric reductase-like transmembrane domain-containing protein [Micromonosporaceae bacterium]